MTHHLFLKTGYFIQKLTLYIPLLILNAISYSWVMSTSIIFRPLFNIVLNQKDFNSGKVYSTIYGTSIRTSEWDST